ncbi:Uncharacterised protein [Bordetella pertussis]|nr:Uncharacterised protein [Bordetella pertussis]
MPVVSSAAMSCALQSPRPVPGWPVSGGAYQPSPSIMPPPSASAARVAPRLLRGVWQAAQWPSPSVR